MRLAEHDGARTVENPQALVEKTSCFMIVLPCVFLARARRSLRETCGFVRGCQTNPRVPAFCVAACAYSSFRRLAQILGAVLKFGEVMQKYQVYFSDWAVALFGDEQFRHPAQIFAVALINLFAEDERHQVGILLDRARFAQIAQLRTMIALARLGRA